MVAAQNGINVENFINQLLTNESYNAPPCSPKFVDSLVALPLTAKEFVQVFVIIDGMKREIFPTVADFGPTVVASHRKDGDPIQFQMSGPLILSQPLEGNGELVNANRMAGCVVVMKRGKINFVEKSRNGMLSGAVGICVIQSDSTWPYAMGDAQKMGTDIAIPCLMVSQKEGDAIQQFLTEHLKNRQNNDTAPYFRLFTRERKLACPICREDFKIDAPAVRLPCQHFYCHDCIRQWLKKRNTCPLCRFKLPTDQPERPAPNQPSQPTPNQVLLEQSMFN